MAFKGSRICKPLPHASQKEQGYHLSCTKCNTEILYLLQFTKQIKRFYSYSYCVFANQFRALELELDQRLAYTMPMPGIVCLYRLNLEALELQLKDLDSGIV